MALTAAQSQLLLQKWVAKQDKKGMQWDRRQLQTLLAELEAGPKPNAPAKPTPGAVVSLLMQQGSGHDQAQSSKAAAFGKEQREARRSRERVAKQHANAAKQVAMRVPAASTTARPASAAPAAAAAAPQGIASIPFFQTRESRPRITSAVRCRSCSRSPDHGRSGAVAPHSPPSATHPPVSIKSIHPHAFVVGAGDCRPEGTVSIGGQPIDFLEEPEEGAQEASSALSPARAQLDAQSAYERQQKQARQLQMSKQAQEAAWLDPSMSHVSAATLHHIHAAKQPQQKKKKRGTKGIQAVAAAPTAVEQAQMDTECDQVPSQDGRVDASSRPPAGLPTAISSAREGALKFIASPTAQSRAGAASSPTRVASNFPPTSSAAYGSGVVSPRRSSAGGSFVPQPYLPQKSQHNAASINVFSHDDNGQAALAEEKGGVTNSYRELQERIKHNQYKPAASGAPRPVVSMAPAAGIRSAVEPPYKGPAASAAQAPSRPATAPAYPAHAAWEAERVALLKELTAAQLRENASQAELNARKTRPEGAVAWWPHDDALEEEEEEAKEGASIDRMRAQREQIMQMQAAAALAKAKQDKIERDQAAKENAARAASSPPRSARYRRGASVGPVLKSPPFPHVGPAEARAYSATIRAAGSSPPHSHGGAHEQHRYNLHHRRDSEVSEGEYSFKNVEGELVDELRESLRKDVEREAAQEDEAYNARSQRRAAAMAGGGQLDDEFKQFDDEDRKAAAAASMSRQGEPSMHVGGDVSSRPAQGGQAFFIPAGPASRVAPPLRRGEEVSQSFQAAPSVAAGFGPAVDAQAHDLAESARQRAAADQLKNLIDKHEHEQAEQRRQAAGLARQSADAHAWINRFEMEAGMSPSLPSHPPPPSASFRATVAPLPPAPAPQDPTLHSSFSGASRGPGYSRSADTSIESVMQLAHNPIIAAFQRDPSTVRMPPATVAAVAVAAAAAVEATVGPNSPLRNSRNLRSARSSPARGGVADVARQFSPRRSMGGASSSVPYRPLSPPARVSDLSDVSSNVSQLSSAPPVVPLTAAALASQQKLDWYSAELARLQERQAERERQQQAQLSPVVAAATALPHHLGGPVPPTNEAAAEAALAASRVFGDAPSTARASAEARSRERARLDNEYAEALRTQREQAERKMEDLTRKALQSSSSVGKSHGLTSPSRTTVTGISPVVAAFVPPMGSSRTGVGGAGAGVGTGAGVGAGVPSSFVVSVRPASSFAPPASTGLASQFSTAAAPAPAPVAASSQMLNASNLSQISSMGASSSSMRSSFGPGAPPRQHHGHSTAHNQTALDLDTPSELSSASSEEEEQLRRATNASRGIPARGAGAATRSTLGTRGVYQGATVESGEDSDDEEYEASVAVATAAAAAHLDDTLDDGDDVNGSLASVGTDEDAELDEESESYFSSHVKRTYEVTVTVDESKRK